MKLIKGLALVLFILFISACSQDSNSEGAAEESKQSDKEEGKEYNLQMSVTSNENSTWYQAAEKLANDLNEESDGRITLEVFANEQLSGGDSGKAVELLAKGTIDLTFNSTIIYSILDERFGVASAPFLFKNFEDVESVMNGDGGKALNELLREKGIEPLGYGENGFRQVTNSVREIRSPEDVEGLKIRIPGISMYTDLWNSLGADSLTMTFSEVFTSLQQNTIDGQENPMDAIYSFKLNEVQDYITMWNYSYDPLVLGLNKELFDSMSEEDQELFHRLGKEAAQYQKELTRELEAEQIGELEEKGMQFYYPTDEELEAFKEKVQPVYSKYEEIWGADLLDAFSPQ